MSCFDDDTVLALIEGRLARPQLAHIDDHLDDCPTCRDVIAQIARTQARPRTLERGHTIGRYVVGDLLGSGAMGDVYSAWEPELDRRVAIKILRADQEAGSARERVVREAQAMAKLDHPNVVGVHEVGTTAEGVFVAMDLVDGEPLRAWIATRRPWREVVRVLVDLARGLAAIHASGVVHRDVKPDNVIVGHDGRARIGDFGLARTGASTSSPVPPAASIAASAIAGTPAYMAPEVLRGGAASAASDQFSFGVTAYEVLAGTRPFAGTTWAALSRAIERTAVSPIPAVPSWLDAAIRRCLAVDPARRFAGLGELADRLAERLARARPTRWIVAAGGLALVASVATWLAVRGSTEPSCVLGSAGLADIWNASARARLAPLGAPAVAAIDRWAGQWTAERDAACSAADAPPRLAARARCLDQRRDELAALVGRLAGADGDRVVDALTALPAPAECRVADAGGDPIPLDPDRAAAVHEIATALAPVRAAIALGDVRAIASTADVLVAKARAAGHAPTLAAALLAYSDSLRGAGNLDAAAVAARDALAAAERGHDDLEAAHAAVARVAIAGDRRDLATADDLGALAAAAVDRAGAPVRLAATVLQLRGLIAYNRGQLPEAATLLDAARARFVEASGERSTDVATAESALGSVARAAGSLAVAEADHRAALALDRALRGPQHPDIARDLHNLAGVLRLRGDLEAALADYREALAIEVAVRGDRSIEAALTHNSIGLVEMQRHDWAAARGDLELARDALTAADAGDRAFAEHNLGLVAAATGDHRAALEHFAAAGPIYAATIGDTAAPAIRLYLDRARSELALADLAAARADATHALDAARAADLGWIGEDAAAVVAETGGGRPVTGRAGVQVAKIAPKSRAKPPVKPDTRPDPEPDGSATAATPDVPVEPVVHVAQPDAPPPPPPARPGRDVGVYGSSQTWP